MKNSSMPKQQPQAMRAAMEAVHDALLLVAYKAGYQWALSHNDATCWPAFLAAATSWQPSDEAHEWLLDDSAQRDVA